MRRSLADRGVAIPERGPRGREAAAFSLNKSTIVSKKHMAWNEELKRVFGSRCVECGQAFEDGEARQELAFGHAMHRACYAKVLDKIERGVVGQSGEESERGFLHQERAEYLKRDEDREREKLAFERTAALFGMKIAERIERLLCQEKKNEPPKTTA